MTIAVLYPRRDYTAIAERVASWQAQIRLRRADDVSAMIFYDEDEPASEIVAHVHESHVLVILDPLIIVERDFATTLREATASPHFYFCPTEWLRDERRTLSRAIEGRSAAISDAGVRTWHREPPPDLLPFIPANAQSLLHVACGNGTLGEQVKKRQRCRVVGIENRRDAAAEAKRRIDDVYSGDLAEVVEILKDRFDCVVMSGVVEQLLDPWSLLAELRRLGKMVVMSIPNIASERTIANLTAGHFPVAEQVRYFTRESVVELIDIAGWTLERIEPAGETQFIVVARNTAAG